VEVEGVTEKVELEEYGARVGGGGRGGRDEGGGVEGG